MALNPKSKFGYLTSIVALCFATHAFAQGSNIASSSTGIDERFAIASKRFGDGQVEVSTQRNSRRDGTGASSQSRYVFNCLEQTYDRVFDTESEPADFPAGSQNTGTQRLNKDSEILPLAQQACKEHGLQILELRW